MNGPRDPALAAILQATVRVAGGSGVVIRNGRATLVVTANHVVKGDGPHLVRCGSAASEQTVLARSDNDQDVAVLGAPVELEAFALSIAGPDDQARVADPVWASGFPRGWNESDPVLVRGAVAGVGAENWANLDGTWGNSGGPLCRVIKDVPTVVGLLLGRAGEGSNELDALKRSTADRRARYETFRQLAEKMWLEALQTPEVRPVDPALLLREVQATLTQVSEVGVLLGLLDDHFRTGFLRFTDAAAIRKLL